MLLSWLAVAAGLGLLVFAADRFIYGSAGLARTLGVSPLVIGMVIVGFGTSAPEMAVSALAAAQGNPGISIGNAVGSNLANVALIMGLCALIQPIVVQRAVLRVELPMVVAVSVAVLLMCLDGALTYRDGALLALGLAGFLGWMFISARRGEAPIEHSDDMPPPVPTLKAAVWIVVGLVLLIGSSQLLIWGAVNIARAFGISDLVVGLTVVAIGTSLPELAASLAGLIKGEDDIALGNILGSNLFNLLAILQAPAWIAPGPVPDGLVGRDLPMMLGVIVMLFLFAFSWRRDRHPRINRVEGGILLTSYIAYTAYLIQTSPTA